MSEDTANNADDVRNVLLALYERDRELTAEQVVHEAASNPGSPLHARFEWDDTVAAHQYRLEQARQLIRNYDIMLEERSVRQFVYVKSTNSYQPVQRVMERVDWREEMLQQFEREAKQFVERWSTHKVVAQRFAEWAQQLKLTA